MARGRAGFWEPEEEEPVWALYSWTVCGRRRPPKRTRRRKA
jgi:hypothetical protein